MIALTAAANACPRCKGALIREPAGHQGAIGETDLCCFTCGWRGYQRPPDTTSPASANRSAALFGIRDRRSVRATEASIARRRHRHQAMVEMREDGMLPLEIGPKVGLSERSVYKHLRGECECEVRA